MQSISLYELNTMVKELMETTFASELWVRAEISSMSLNARGHCYMELVEKDARSTTPVAKARAMIWAYAFPMVRQTFENATNQALRAGIKVQVKVKVTFHEAYGYSLIITDIDPTYTMGSMALLRKEIIDHLTRDGILDMNAQLELPRPLQRIAVVSSATAAGYGDFCAQLEHNAGGYAFAIRLFPAVMQGEQTAASVIAALEAIYREVEQWDVVVIIRGGGAVSDLAGFENYDLAACCAQFPLPIITGIGHERDTTVLDYVAHTHLKTPTAVAAFLIERMDAEAAFLNDASLRVRRCAQELFSKQKELLSRIEARMNVAAATFTAHRRNQLALMTEHITNAASSRIKSEQMRLDNDRRRLLMSARHVADKQITHIQAMERALTLFRPDNILRLGYSITRKDGKAVLNADSLKEGDVLTTTFAHGKTTSCVVSNKRQ